MSVISAYAVPHPPISIDEIGKDRVVEVEKTIKGYEQFSKEIAKEKPETIIIITPHTTIYGDYFHISTGKCAEGTFENYDAPEVKIKVNYDEELAKEISVVCHEQHLHAGGMGNGKKELDHGTMIPLYYINKNYKKYKVVRISIADFTSYVHYQLGMCIAKACENLDRKVCVVGSGDLSHFLTKDGPYGYRTEGPIFDDMMVDTLKTANFIEWFTYSAHFIEKSGTCGLKPFSVMAGTLDGKNVDTNFMSYQGNLGVGYAICGYKIANEVCEERKFYDIYRKKIIDEINQRDKRENSYVRLARLTIENLVLQNKFITIKDVEDILDVVMLTQKAGAFVSIRKEGEIRGCIGTIIPTTTCVAHEIVNNAINAAYNDPRFNPISVDELPYLTYSVDVLEEPEMVDSIEELDVRRYGVIVENEEKRGLLLPNLEAIKTPKQQVEVALKKAGIDEDEHYIMQRFEVIRYC